MTIDNLELWDEWSECDYCNVFGKSLAFHARDKDNPIHQDHYEFNLKGTL